MTNLLSGLTLAVLLTVTALLTIDGVRADHESDEAEGPGAWSGCTLIIDNGRLRPLCPEPNATATPVPATATPTAVPPTIAPTATPTAVPPTPTTAPDNDPGDSEGDAEVGSPWEACQLVIWKGRIRVFC